MGKGVCRRWEGEEGVKPGVGVGGRGQALEEGPMGSRVFQPQNRIREFEKVDTRRDRLSGWRGGSREPRGSSPGGGGSVLMAGSPEETWGPEGSV